MCMFISKRKQDNFSLVQKLNLTEQVFWMPFRQNFKLLFKVGNLASHGSFGLQDDYSNCIELTQASPEYKALCFTCLYQEKKKKTSAKSSVDTPSKFDRK